MESYGSEVITTYILETWGYKIVQNIAEQAFLKEIVDDYCRATHLIPLFRIVLLFNFIMLLLLWFESTRLRFRVDCAIFNNYEINTRVTLKSDCSALE